MKSFLAALLGSTLIIAPITVIDGDTVRAGGHVYRLVDYDTAETGDRAQCPSERLLAARATERLRELLRGAAAHKLEQVSCSCRPGTEGTAQCNYGRLCATLSIDGQNVGEILISEGLAHRYVCSTDRCPGKPSWCPPLKIRPWFHSLVFEFLPEAPSASRTTT
jgi:endonuclease YncB( thermonuclease family)